MRTLLAAALLVLSSSAWAARPLAVGVNDGPGAGLSISPTSDRIFPGEERTLFVRLNTGSSVLHDVRVTLRLAGATIETIKTSAEFTCGNGVCTASTFGPQSTTFFVQIVAPDRDDGGTVSLEADVTSSDADADPGDNHASVQSTLVRRFAVTNTADSGGGSLRQAIIDASRSGFSAPGQIVFRAAPPVVIRPESPLPPLSGIVDFNATDRAVEIRGDLQREGDGITIDDACEVRLRGLTITGFPRNGVNIGTARLCGGVQFPPVVVTGNVIRGNERGIGGSDTDTVWITGNVIGDSRRSAIFLYGGRVAEISENFIGVDREGVAMPNGASGVFVSLFSATVADNVIANNGDFGVAVAANAANTSVRRNRIFGNGETAIDVGLDLESPNGDDAQRNVLNHPVITGAHYDAATDRTVVSVHYETNRTNGDVVVELFASDSLNARGQAQAQRLLSEVFLGPVRDFGISVNGNLTGQWIAATATIQDSLTNVRNVTSELSPAVQVSP